MKPAAFSLRSLVGSVPPFEGRVRGWRNALWTWLLADPRSALARRSRSKMTPAGSVLARAIVLRRILRLL